MAASAPKVQSVATRLAPTGIAAARSEPVIEPRDQRPDDDRERDQAEDVAQHDRRRRGPSRAAGRSRRSGGPGSVSAARMVAIDVVEAGGDELAVGHGAEGDVDGGRPPVASRSGSSDRGGRRGRGSGGRRAPPASRGISSMKGSTVSRSSAAVVAEGGGVDQALGRAHARQAAGCASLMRRSASRCSVVKTSAVSMPITMTSSSPKLRMASA